MINPRNKMTIEEKKEVSSAWFLKLQKMICAEFEKIEEENDSKAKFGFKHWDRTGGGGGIIGLMRGNVFEKVGVNTSVVYGTFTEKFAKEIPGADKDGAFWAAGISLVAHMKNPKVPAVHMNTRMIVTTKSWFGGGADLTPSHPFPEDTEAFHNRLKQACDKFNENYYDTFSKQCREYFFIKHRNEERGVGGIFYDYLDTGNFYQDFEFTKEVGLAFLDIFPKIVRKNVGLEYNKHDQEIQYQKRARYAEFNLVYDRGTRFGLETGGNVEAIFVSMPPVANW
jgi:coproporphyrinogen III oxidase